MIKNNKTICSKETDLKNKSVFLGFLEDVISDMKMFRNYTKESIKNIIEKGDIVLNQDLDLVTIKELRILSPEAIKNFEDFGKKEINIEHLIYYVYEEERAKTVIKEKSNTVKKIEKEDIIPHIEEKENMNKDILFNIFISKFEKGNTFQARKFLFEHVIDKYVEDFIFMDGFKYSEGIDRIFSEIISSKNTNLKKEIENIRNTSQNKEELKTLFNLIHWQISENKLDISTNIFHSRFILENLRGRSFNVPKKINSSILFNKLKGEDVTLENVRKMLELDINNPSIFKSKFSNKGGEFFNFLSSGLKKFRPGFVNDIEKEIKSDKKILDVTSDVNKSKAFSKFKKYLSNNFGFVIDNLLIEEIIKYYNLVDKNIGIYKEKFCEAKFDITLSLNRDKNIEISEEEHKQLILDKLLFEKLVSSLKLSIKLDEGNLKKLESKSKIIGFFGGKLKGKTLKPIFGSVIKFFNNRKALAIFGGIAKTLKFKALGLIALGVGTKILTNKIANTDRFRVVNVLDEINKGFNFNFSPEIIDFIVKNREQINNLGINIETLHYIEKLQKEKEQIEDDIIVLSTETYYGKNNNEDVSKVKESLKNKREKLSSIELQIKLGNKETDANNKEQFEEYLLAKEFYKLLEDQIKYLNN